MSRSKRRRALGAMMALGLAGAVGAALSPVDHIVAQTHGDPATQAAPQGQTAVAPHTPQVARAAQLGEAFATVAESVSPAVVSIRVEAVREAPQMQLPQGLPFHFGVPNDGQPNVVRGGGSGVLIRSDGYVLTNNHVVQNATRIEVVMRDGRVLPGTVVGTDPATDLAVVKVQGSDLPTARFASSDDAREGAAPGPEAYASGRR